MPDNKVRVGVIGTSWYADLMHLPNLKSHPQVELVAICGRQPSLPRKWPQRMALRMSTATIGS